MNTKLMYNININLYRLRFAEIATMNSVLRVSFSIESEWNENNNNKQYYEQNRKIIKIKKKELSGLKVQNLFYAGIGF